jgi:hypothetical protein
MNRVAAKIAQKIGVLFQNKNFHARAGEQKTEHHAGWPAPDNATAGLHFFDGGSLRHLKTKRNSCFTLVEKVRRARREERRNRNCAVYCWFVSSRDAGAANHFMHDLAGRLASRVQLTTDGHHAYLSAVESAFGSEIDYAMLIKIYGAERAGETRYSPAQCMGARKAVIAGTPDKAHISTSHTERQNLTMRMQMRRFTRLTNAFSKKIENHEAAIALHYMHYNFARIHQTLRVTPAMEAGISDHVWSLEEIVSLLA